MNKMTLGLLKLSQEMQKSIDLGEQIIADISFNLLRILLKDNTTGSFILWATDNYAQYGNEYTANQEIKPELIIGKNTNIIQPRASKSQSEQIRRTSEKAEVFTPSWICNKQNNLIDSAWFGRKNVFNSEDGIEWNPIKEKIEFFENKSWIDYVNDIRLEISCGEAPYIVSRYDTVSGEYLPIDKRIGFLDRKLRVVSENCIQKGEWIKYSILALKSVYAYEWQGDNLVLARENVLLSYLDYYKQLFNELPNEELLIEVATIISWNIFQMDGIKYVIPNSCKNEIVSQYNLFGENIIEEYRCEGCDKDIKSKHNGIYSKIKDWQKNQTITFISLLTRGRK